MMISMPASATAIIEQSHKKCTKNTSHLGSWGSSRLESAKYTSATTLGSTSATVSMIIVSVSS
jgi:hypothetical protein